LSKEPVPMPVNDLPLPIKEDDETIRQMVEGAELPSLLASLAHVTGDKSLIAEEFRAPLLPLPTGVEPQGGMPPDVQIKARAAAVESIKRYRDAGCPPPADMTTAELMKLIAFITGDGTERYASLLLHELAIPQDRGAPTWTKADLAPESDFSVAVIGAGMSGLVVAHRLAQAQIPVVVIEKNSEVGGTWWENSYPGCRLDTSNYAYSYSFAQKDDWPNYYSTQKTILKYLQNVADLFSVRKLIQFNTEVLSAAFDEDNKRWKLRLRRGSGAIETLETNVVVAAVGQLNRPKLPDIPGLSAFKGASFHSSQWRHDIDLRNRKVGIVGTGASAFQIVPAIAGEVAELKVYQRTPAWMLPAPNYHKPVDPGLMWLFRHIPYYHRWFRFYQFWISSENRLPFFTIEDNWEGKVSVSSANESLRQALFDHLAPQYADRPDLLAKVVPSYPPGAKRMLRDNGVWAATLKRENVELVTAAIEQVTSRGIRTRDGREREADVLIYATGFNASDHLEPMTIVGRGGRDLHAYWNGDARAFLGGCIPGFPNFFSVYGPNTSLIINGSIFFMSECTTNYIMECLRLLLEKKCGTIECRAEAYESYSAEVDAGNARMVWGGISSVSSWYRNKFGRASQAWPFTLGDYWNRTRHPDPESFLFE
jgi:4-hydroxyacetophenone monooxygenase